MVIRRAQTADMPEILALVEQVFTGEQGIPAWMHHIPPERTPMWWCAAEEDTVVACAAAYCEDGVWHMGRIAVQPGLRGRGIGTKLLRRALGEIFAGDIDCVHMEARDATVRILTRMGAEVTGEAFGFFGDRCTPICICREVWYNVQRSY